MGRPGYLILHGYQASGPGHWQSWLAGRLRSADATVRFPDLPDADAPRPQPWVEALERELDAFGEAPVVICHSLACLLWMHHAAGGGQPAARLLLVAPPSQTGAPEVLQPFFPVPRVELGNARMVCSDNDPYCPEGAQTVYPGLPTDVLPGAGHINPESGYGPWPSVEAWARDDAAPITGQ
jgi:predicted alpha/beta hydrolase family esterase